MINKEETRKRLKVISKDVDNICDFIEKTGQYKKRPFIKVISCGSYCEDDKKTDTYFCEYELEKTKDIRMW